MTYKECLERIKGLNMLQVNVAYQVENHLKEKIVDYERVCQFIYGCMLETDEISISTMCMCFSDLLDDGEYTEKEIVNWQYYKFIEKASYY